MRNKGLKNGFTLIEILISLGIFALLLGIIVNGFMSTKKIENIKQGALELVTNIQKAQNLALTGISHNNAVPVGGYGVHLNNLASQYNIFADFYSSDANCNASQLDGKSDEKYNCAKEDYAIINLPAGVSICKIGSGASSAPSLDLAFKAPEYRPYINGLLGGTTQIILKMNDANVCRKVTVQDIAGRASEQVIKCTDAGCP
ncbi:MAG: type II secretion system protein [Patescibacteria group bacterium]